MKKHQRLLAVVLILTMLHPLVSCASPDAAETDAAVPDAETEEAPETEALDSIEARLPGSDV